MLVPLTRLDTESIMPLSSQTLFLQRGSSNNAYSHRQQWIVQMGSAVVKAPLCVSYCFI